MPKGRGEVNWMSKITVPTAKTARGKVQGRGEQEAGDALLESKQPSTGVIYCLVRNEMQTITWV